MAPRTKYNIDTFRTLVIAGKSKAEIMAEMEIKNHPTFNNMMLKLMDIDKKYYSVSDSKKRVEKKILKVNIGKRNTLTLSAKILADSGFAIGDTFQVKFTKKKITLMVID